MKVRVTQIRESLIAALLCAGLFIPSMATGEARPFVAPDVPDAAFGVGAVEKDDPRVEARLITDVETVPPPQGR